MKKICFSLAIPLLVIWSFTIVGCKKDWTCECRTQLSDGTYLVTSTTTLSNKTKKDAETECNALDSSIGGVVINDCSLK